MKLLEIIRLMLENEIITQPKPKVKPTTKPEPKPVRRPLTPGKHVPKTAPKAEGKVNENEQGLIDKITQRYKSLK